MALFFKLDEPSTTIRIFLGEDGSPEKARDFWNVHNRDMQKKRRSAFLINLHLESFMTVYYYHRITQVRRILEWKQE
jgi:hypothetical protein